MFSKKSIYSLVFISVLSSCATVAFADVGAAPVQSNNLTPENGYYKASNSNFCAVQIEGDEQTGDLLVASLEGCSDNGINHYKRSSATEFTIHVNSSPWSDKDISDCMPTSQNPKPCNDNLYDPQTGKLIVQAGDSAFQEQVITVVNSTSVIFNPIQWVITHGSTVIAKYANGSVQDPALMSRAGDAAPTYVRPRPVYNNGDGGVEIHNVPVGG